MEDYTIVGKLRAIRSNLKYKISKVFGKLDNKAAEIHSQLDELELILEARELSSEEIQCVQSLKRKAFIILDRIGSLWF